MYGIVIKIGRGSWQMATSKIFDDKEKAEDIALSLKPNYDVSAKIKVVYLGDAFDWNKD